MTTTNLRSVAAHVLRNLARAQSRGRMINLEDLVAAIGADREDVREAVSRLHAEGHVDAQRMRLTFTGLAVAASMRECKLREPRSRRMSERASAGAQMSCA